MTFSEEASESEIKVATTTIDNYCETTFGESLLVDEADDETKDKFNKFHKTKKNKFLYMESLTNDDVRQMIADNVISSFGNLQTEEDDQPESPQIETPSVEVSTGTDALDAFDDSDLEQWRTVHVIKI